MTEHTRATADLRRAVVVAGALSQLAVAAVGVLPWALLPVTVALLVAGSWFAHAHPATRRHLRWLAVPLVLALVLNTFTHVDSRDTEALMHSLGWLLVGVQLVQPLGEGTRRDLQSSLLVAGALLLLAAGLATTVSSGLPILLGGPGLVAGALLSRRLALAEHAVEPAAGSGVLLRPGTIAATTAVCVVVTLVAWLLLPSSAAFGLRSRLATAGGTAATEAPGSRGFGQAEMYVSGRLDLRARGTLPDTPVLLAGGDVPDLWRATVLDRYDGSTWQHPPAGWQLLGATPGVQLPVSDSDPAAVGDTRVDRAVPVGGPAGAVWAPGVIRAVRSNGQIFSNGLGRAVVTGAVGLPYEVTSVVATRDPALLARATGGEQPVGDWTQLPAALPSRVAALAEEITAGADTRYEQVRAIENWLVANATYQLDSPVPPPGADAVDDFLFTSRRGFCEQFASAAAVMLRTLGIPARLVTGLAYGGPAPSGDGRLFRVSDAHAWIEVWYPGIGWSPSDPTAGAQLAAGGRGSAFEAKVRALLAGAESLPGGRRGIALLLVVVTVAAGIVTSRRSPRRTAWWRRRRSAPLGPVTSAFGKLERALPRQREPHESAREYLARTGLTGLDDAVRVLEQELYAATQPSDVVADRAVRAFTAALPKS